MISTAVFVVGLIGLAAWILRDGMRRGIEKPVLYAIGALGFAILAVPLYFTNRPLRAGEVRAGGGAYSFAKYFAIFCCALGALSALLTLAETPFLLASTDDVLVEVLSGVLAAGLQAAVFAAVGGTAMAVGLLLRKRSAVESGPAAAVYTPGGTARSDDGQHPFDTRR